MTETPGNKSPIALEDRDVQDGRLHSPSAGRNKDIIAQTLAEVLPQNARVLEIASGTGQHGITTLHQRPDLHWQFSDPDAESRTSQSAWIAHSGLTLPDPLMVDTRIEGWPQNLPQRYDAMYCANMIHIAPIEALQGLAASVADALEPQGICHLYGPFLFESQSAPSNLDFDRSLKSRNPAWGVRELETVKHIFAKHGFNQAILRDMPSNNHFLSLSRL